MANVAVDPGASELESSPYHRGEPSKDRYPRGLIFLLSQVTVLVGVKTTQRQ